MFHSWIVLKLSHKATSGSTIGLRSVSLLPGALTGMSPTRSLVGQECSQTMTGRDCIQVTRLFWTLQSDKVSGHTSRSSVGHVSYCVAMQVGLLPYYSWWCILVGHMLLQGLQSVPRSMGLLLELWAGMIPPRSLGRLRRRQDKNQENCSKVHRGRRLFPGL